LQTKSFKDHFLHPHNRGKPTFFQSSVSFKSKDLEVTLFLDVNSKEKIQSLQYLYEGNPLYLAYFSALSEIVKNMPLIEAKLVSHDDFKNFFKHDDEFDSLENENQTPWLNLALVLLKNVIEDYEGSIHVPYFEMKMENYQHLICRCFGVYRNELVNLIRENDHFELKDLMIKTKAGAGCKSCQIDIDEIYFETRETYPLKKKIDGMKVTSDYKLQNKTTAQWVIEMDKSIKSFLITNTLSVELIEIEKFKFPELRLKISNVPEKLSIEKLEEKLDYYIEQSVGLKVKIVWKY
jgi:NifU-like protein involved in Fe-S cluster formation/bacterioferritin-associated ferredoxin